MFIVKLVSLCSLLWLVYFFPCTAAGSKEDCYDKICELGEIRILCYKKNGNKVCNDIDGKFDCRDTHGGERTRPDKTCESNFMTTCTCADEDIAGCICETAGGFITFLGVSITALVLFVLCGLYYSRWYITKKEQVKHQIRVEYERAQNNPNDSESNTAVGDSMSHHGKKSHDRSLAPPVSSSNVRPASPRPMGHRPISPRPVRVAHPQRPTNHKH